MSYKCIVVDDDEISRMMLKKHIEDTKGLELVALCPGAREALDKLEENDVDIIFLDIRMPEMDGMEMLENLKNSYEVIMVTNEKSYAVEAYDRQVTDYLLKPFEYERFKQAVAKAVQNAETFRRNKERMTQIFVKSDGKVVRIPLDEILFVEALADYIVINSVKKKYIVHHTMKGVERRLPKKYFVRIHRSYIVNIFHIDFIADLSVNIQEKALPIGASYKDAFYDRLNFL